jgi:hypothetical protein
MKIYEVRVGFEKKVDIYGNTEYTPNFEYYTDKARAEARYSEGEFTEEVVEITREYNGTPYTTRQPLGFYEVEKANKNNIKVEKVKVVANKYTIREIEVIE